MSECEMHDGMVAQMSAVETSIVGLDKKIDKISTKQDQIFDMINQDGIDLAVISSKVNTHLDECTAGRKAVVAAVTRFLVAVISGAVVAYVAVRMGM